MEGVECQLALHPTTSVGLVNSELGLCFPLSTADTRGVGNRSVDQPCLALQGGYGDSAPHWASVTRGKVKQGLVSPCAVLVSLIDCEGVEAQLLRGLH